MELRGGIEEAPRDLKNLLVENSLGPYGHRIIYQKLRLACANPCLSSGNRFIMTRVLTRCFYVQTFPLQAALFLNSTAYIV